MLSLFSARGQQSCEERGHFPTTVQWESRILRFCAENTMTKIASIPPSVVLARRMKHGFPLLGVTYGKECHCSTVTSVSGLENFILLPTL